MPKIAFDTYGKTKVRLVYVEREKEPHELKELSVDIFLEGAFENAFTKGDNTPVLPTDTMKNTVYVFARKNGVKSVEEFARDLARHFLATVSHVSRARVDVAETPWARMGDSASAFVQTGNERRIVKLAAARSEETIRAGIGGLQILKTADSAFAGFRKDPYTTLPETHDRLLGTVVEADWLYAGEIADYNGTHSAIRAALLATFAAHKSVSVQQTLYDMGSAVLEKFASVKEVHLVLPNKHCLLFDLSRFGLDNPNRVFYPIDEPSGYIEAVLSR